MHHAAAIRPMTLESAVTAGCLALCCGCLTCLCWKTGLGDCTLLLLKITLVIGVLGMVPYSYAWMVAQGNRAGLGTWTIYALTVLAVVILVVSCVCQTCRKEQRKREAAEAFEDFLTRTSEVGRERRQTLRRRRRGSRGSSSSED
jgi:uncharacterized membrane protein